jgi:hypothetical protein
MSIFGGDMLKGIVVSLAAFIAASAVFSGHNPSVTILVTSAKQDCPVQIRGFKLPQKVGGPPLLVVHNGTEKEVRVFYVSGYVGNPRKLKGSDPQVGFILGGEPPDSTKESQLAPSGDSELAYGVLKSHNFANLAKNVNSNCLHVAVLVTTVEFSDGSVWDSQAGREANQDLWRNSIRAESMKGCENSEEMEETLKELDSAGYRESGMPTNASPELVQYYTVSCPLVKLEGRLGAVCSQ